jgi:hypothetical protein
VDFEALEWVDRFEGVADGTLTLGDLAALLTDAMGGDVAVEIDD